MDSKSHSMLGVGDTLRLLTALESPVRDWAKQTGKPQGIERNPHNTN